MNADPKILRIAKYKCLVSFLFFTRYFFKARFNRKFVIGEHHKIICDAIERVLRGECKRLIINIAPRYGKTELGVKNLIACGLAHNPSAKFIHLTYAKSLALDNSEDAKDLVQSAEYQALFPHVQIKPNSDSKEKWYTTAGGGVYATAAGGQVTGFGAGAVDEENSNITEFLDDIQQKEGFGGAIIIDDSIKPEDANSDVIRERVNDRFETTIRNRVNSRRTPIIVIGQRVHPHDLPGYLISIEPGEWEVISLPCIKADGNALWPFKHTLAELLKLRKVNEIVFETQYQQNAKPKEGLLFAEEDLHYYDPATVDVEKLAEYRHMVIDPADEGGDDLSAPSGYLIGNKIYVTDVIYNNNGTDENEPACVQMILRNKYKSVTIEGNSAWILFGKNIRTKVQDVNENCDIRIIKNTTNKHTRILAQSSFIRNNFVFRKDWQTCSVDYRKFMTNLTSYRRIQEGTGKNKHDDAPDSCAELANYYSTNFRHLY
jgi:predicted phage terminase large subunit-like protein